jgi:hypothetical protein
VQKDRNPGKLSDVAKKIETTETKALRYLSEEQETIAQGKTGHEGEAAKRQGERMKQSCFRIGMRLLSDLRKRERQCKVKKLRGIDRVACVRTSRMCLVELKTARVGGESNGQKPRSKRKFTPGK